MTILSESRPFGIQEPKKLVGFPGGKTRIRMRTTDFVIVRVRPSDGGIRQFLVEEVGNEWRCAEEIGANIVAERA